MAVHSGQQLELYLSRDCFAAGRRLSGVVVYKSVKPIDIRSISIIIHGVENPAGSPFSKSAVFFDRLQILTGTKKPRFAAERVSMVWNAFLGRNNGRSLSGGEHIYPFTFQLPASLPPSYSGKAGKVEYTVTACVQYPVAGNYQISENIKVVFIPRANKASQVALSYPSLAGTTHASSIRVAFRDTAKISSDG